jgi:hypothetical protein
MAYTSSQAIFCIDCLTLGTEEKENIKENTCTGGKKLTNKQLEDFLKKSSTITGEYKRRQSIKCMLETVFSFVPNDDSLVFNAIFDVKQKPYDNINPSTLIGYLRYKKSPSKKYEYIVKTVIDQYDTSSLLHEASAGILATNKLKKYIPNFAYTYLLLNHCNDNTFGSKIKFCFSPGYTRYLINENIEHDFSLAKLLRITQEKSAISKKDLFGIFIQIFNALSYALDKVGFCHYDLHDENILIKKLDTPMHIKNYLSDKDDYITVNYLAVIIDYEHSTYSYKNNRYCLSQYVLGERYTETPNPVFDYYKLLMNAYYSADTGKNRENVLPVLNLLFQFSDDLLFKGKVKTSTMKKEYDRMFSARKPVKKTNPTKILGSTAMKYKNTSQRRSNDKDNTFMGVIPTYLYEKNKDSFSYKLFYKNIINNYPVLLEEIDVRNKNFLNHIYNRKEQLK